MRSARVRRLVAARFRSRPCCTRGRRSRSDASPGRLLPLLRGGRSGSVTAGTRPVPASRVAALVWLVCAVVLVRTASASVGEIVDRGCLMRTRSRRRSWPRHTPSLLCSSCSSRPHSPRSRCRRRLTGRSLPLIVIAAGVGIPATINPSRNTIAMGALALLAVLWPLAVAAMPDRSAFGPGVAVVADDHGRCGRSRRDRCSALGRCARLA